MIDQSTVDRIFEASQIIDVVQDYIPLKRRGVNYLGNCPFHNEKTPSFTVSPAKNIFKCFGCGKGGNPVNFVMEYEKISYYEALKVLAKRYHIEIVEAQQSEEALQQKSDRESMLIVSDFARKLFIDNILTHNEGRTIGLSYFKERGFREDTIKKFELGYCLEERDNFTQKAQKQGYKLEYLVKTGLTIHSEGHSPFDRFSGRVMFPIHDLTGKVIAFGGRVMKTDKKTAKYLNSPESDIYHKSNVLYGIFQAKKAIVQFDKCYLVEGYTDVISMHQAGIENVVASSGTSLTAEQIRLMKRFTNNITILYDGDPAGIKASLRGIDLILEEGMNVRVILLPTPEDPDSFARSHSTSELTEYLQNNETDFIHFKTSLLLDEVQNDPIKRAQAISEIVKSISIVPDAITRSLFLRECSKILEVEENVLYAEVLKLRQSSNEKKFNRESPSFIPQPVDNKVATPIEINDLEVVEREIVRLMLIYGQHPLFELTNEDNIVTRELTVEEYLVQEIQRDELEFTNPAYRQIFEAFQHFVNNAQLVDNKYFINHPEVLISKTTVDLISQKYELSKMYTKKEVFLETEDMKLKTTVPELTLTYKTKRIKLMIKQVQVKLLEAQKNNETEELLNLQQQLMLLFSLYGEAAKGLGNRVIV
ncbi:MAG: DNA primase [Bacteroidota bacterium]|nr:DNA primase [Bacteroidota bacterium]